MLHIVWFILKILGILLAVIAGLFVLLMLLVLFVPIRYRVRLENGETGIQGAAGIGWLLNAFGLRIRYTDGALTVKLRLFWVILLSIYPAKERRRRPQREKKRKAKEVGKDTPAVKETEKNTLDMKDDGEDTMPVGIEADGTGPEKTEPDRTEAEASGAENPEPDRLETDSRTSLWERIGQLLGWLWRHLTAPVRFLQRIRKALQNLRYTIGGFYDKISGMKDKLDAYRKLWEQDETKQAFALCKDGLFGLLRHVGPGKISGELVFGTGDPAMTGQLYGLYCALCAWHQYKVRLTPDFEAQVFDGHIRLSGHIRLCHVVLLAVRIFFDKNIRFVIRKWKQT